MVFHESQLAWLALAELYSRHSPFIQMIPICADSNSAQLLYIQEQGSRRHVESTWISELEDLEYIAQKWKLVLILPFSFCASRM